MKQRATIQQLQRRARSLGFESLQSVTGRTTVVDLVPAAKRVGIYLLGFRTGEAYVGLSTNIANRFVQHARTHEDIDWFTFKMISQSQLAMEERRCIESVERAGFKLRNISLASFAPSNADLDAIISPQEQNRFLRSGIARPQTDLVPLARDLRRKYLKKFGSLMAHPHGLDAVFGLASYLPLALPCPQETQISFWNVTAFVGSRCPLRVNVNWQEVFSAHVFNGELVFFLQVARHPLANAFGKAIREIGRCLAPAEITSFHYAPGGQDQVRLLVRNSDFENMLKCQPVVHAIREMNLRLMRKGPCMWGRNHCPQLFDIAWHLAARAG